MAGPVGLTRPRMCSQLSCCPRDPSRSRGRVGHWETQQESLPTVHSTLLTISSHRHQCLTRVVTKQQDSLPWVYIPGSDVGPQIVTSHEPSGRGAGTSVTAPAMGPADLPSPTPGETLGPKLQNVRLGRVQGNIWNVHRKYGQR